VRLRYGDAEEAFRGELVAWLEANLPPREILRQPKQSSADLPPWAREWQRTLFDAGWLVPGWPPELGGRNANAMQQMIYFEEMSRREIPRSLNPQGLGIIAPSIRDYGTPEQRPVPCSRRCGPRSRGVSG
jgi:alkylation response protein AidB-like acyl-CoA dehydrogenase